MAVYPNYDQEEGSYAVPDTGIRVDIATNGAPKAQRLYDQTRKAFVVRHRLTRADKDALVSWIETNLLNTFSFTWVGDNATYTCIFDENPYRVRPLLGGWFDVTVKMREF